MNCIWCNLEHASRFETSDLIRSREPGSCALCQIIDVAKDPFRNKCDSLQATLAAYSGSYEHTCQVKTEDVIDPGIKRVIYANLDHFYQEEYKLMSSLDTIRSGILSELQRLRQLNEDRIPQDFPDKLNDLLDLL